MKCTSLLSNEPLKLNFRCIVGCCVPLHHTIFVLSCLSSHIFIIAVTRHSHLASCSCCYNISTVRQNSTPYKCFLLSGLVCWQVVKLREVVKPSLSTRQKVKCWQQAHWDSCGGDWEIVTSVSVFVTTILRSVPRLRDNLLETMLTLLLLFWLREIADRENIQSTINILWLKLLKRCEYECLVFLKTCFGLQSGEAPVPFSVGYVPCTF